MFDIEKIRAEFPILEREVYGRKLIYLDSAATAQKPLCVVKKMEELLLNDNANIHRGVHRLSEEATELYEAARNKVQSFIGASAREEIIFTAGATASLNTVAYAWGEKFLHEGDNIIISEMEHHSNIVPWQMLCERKNAKLRVIPLRDDLSLDIEAFKALINDHTKLISVAHVSNLLGIINPVEEIISIAHKAHIPVCIDAAQSIPHLEIDVQALDCDFLAFSTHKVYGPTGLGVLYGKKEWLQ
jgi:cysteine desulfurase/selenocysteine lyase